MIAHDPLGGPEEATQLARLQPVKVAGALQALRIDTEGETCGEVELPFLIYAKDFGDLVGVVARVLAHAQVELHMRERQEQRESNGRG